MCKLSDLRTILNLGLHGETKIQKKGKREWTASKDGLAFIQVSDNGRENINWLIVRVTMELDDDDYDNYNTH